MVPIADGVIANGLPVPKTDVPAKSLYHVIVPFPLPVAVKVTASPTHIGLDKSATIVL